MPAILKFWEVNKFSQVYRIELIEDFTIRVISPHNSRLLNMGDWMKEWFGFSEDKNQEILILIEILALIPLEKMDAITLRLAKFYSVYENFETWTKKEVRPDQLFFYGPRKHSLSLEERKQIKIDIHSKIASAFDLNDGFYLFDYPKISYSKTVKNKSDGEDYLKIENGKVMRGGYDGSGSGGEQTSDLESLFYWSESNFNLFTNQLFNGQQKVIQTQLEKNIIKF